MKVNFSDLDKFEVFKFGNDGFGRYFKLNDYYYYDLQTGNLNVTTAGMICYQTNEKVELIDDVFKLVTMKKSFKSLKIGQWFSLNEYIGCKRTQHTSLLFYKDDRCVNEDYIGLYRLDYSHSFSENGKVILTEEPKISIIVDEDAGIWYKIHE